ncbi:DUF3108 domain-containing protein [Ramlibacter humi]|uniref:DUF3108 domain-containing protein n=1 Tax=Ramlibacter humi TaxID=2530451 RepID=A0A4Z0BWC5_9BURK|nr:DUF3108 domain-containing protein [Ramlibacter humi]TFZ03637.1 DUF3108 domain-containing protein [Ramlibacter humi]
MAVAAILTSSSRRRLLVLVAAVLVAHVVALHFFSRWQTDLSLLKPMVAPMYTRLLQPTAPPPPPESSAAPAAQPAPPTGRLHAVSSVPKHTTRTVAAPEPPAPESPPEPPPVAAAEPSPPAEPPVAAASSPAAPASEPAITPSPSVAASTTTASTTTAVVDSWPSDTRLRYKLGGRFRSGQLYGDARVLWQREEARYQVRVEVNVTFMATLVMTSQGEVGATLMPQVYEELRNGKPRGLRMGESEVVLANGTVVQRPAGVQDTASQFVELSHRFASGREKLEVGRAVSLWMARPGAIDLWTYDVVDSEVLRTDLGDIEALHLRPRPIANPRGNITAEMWFAPALQYLPVRILVRMGEEAAIDLLVEAIDQR